MAINNIDRIAEELETLSVSKSVYCPAEQCVEYMYTPSSSVSVLHLNIRSIKKNFDRFSLLLAQINTQCDIIALTECWLQKSPYIPSLTGYESYHTNRRINQNSGIVLYIRKGLNCSVRELASFSDANCFVCGVGAELALIFIYRSPSIYNIDDFLNSLNDILSTLNSIPFIGVVGDVNINIADNDPDQRSDRYLNLTASYGILPAHTLPTRGENCLDHVLLKSKSPSVTMVIQTHVTDHYPVLLSARLRPTPTRVSFTRSRVNQTAVVRDITETDLSPVLNTSDVDTAVNLLVSQLSGIVKKHTKTYTISRSKLTIKPWITPGLLRCIRNRDSMHRKLKGNPDNIILKITYSRYRNFINKLLKNLKRSYLKTLLVNARNNARSTWDAVKTITNMRSSTNPSNSLLKLHTDPTASINSVNKFFANVGNDLASRIVPSSSDAHPPSCAQLLTGESLVIFDVDCEEMERIILGLRNNCSVGWDCVSSTVLKSTRHVLIPLLVHICNLSVSTGVFPNAFKRALVHPIHKSGDNDVVNNYRPISVLPVMSKILEKVLNNRLINYLESKQLLSSNQFGFRQGKSTSDAVSVVVDNVIEHLDKKEKCLCIFLDISKAFDTVSIPLLLFKLERMGVRGKQLDIFKSYLSNRIQAVKIENQISNDEQVSIGIPQGSIIGPTLFTVFINDLCQLQLPNCRVVTYADDTALLIHGSTWEEVRILAENALAAVLGWLSSNLLTINLKKTFFVPFVLRQCFVPPNSFSIKAHTCKTPNRNCTCPFLTAASQIKYLGVTIDQTLSWRYHIDSLTSRVRKLIYIFKSLRHVADLDTLYMTYSALCMSLLTYCITVWGGAAKTIMLKLERAQRAVLKVMLKKAFRYPTSLLYDESSVLSVRQLYIQQAIMLKHMLLKYDPALPRRRRKYQVCQSRQHRTALAGRHFHVLSSRLYNTSNNKLNIFSLSRYEVKKRVTQWLKGYDYDATESLLV